MFDYEDSNWQNSEIATLFVEAMEIDLSETAHKKVRDLHGEEVEVGGFVYDPMGTRKLHKVVDVKGDDILVACGQPHYLDGSNKGFQGGTVNFVKEPGAKDKKCEKCAALETPTQDLVEETKPQISLAQIEQEIDLFQVRQKLAQLAKEAGNEQAVWLIERAIQDLSDVGGE